MFAVSRIPGTSTFPTPTRVGGRGPPRELPGISNPLLHATHPPPVIFRRSPSNADRWEGAGIWNPGRFYAVSKEPTQPPRSASWLPAGVGAIGTAEIPSRQPRPTLGDSDYQLDLDPSQASRQVLTFRRAFPDFVLGTDGDNDDTRPVDGNNVMVAVGRIPGPEARLQRPVGGLEDQIGHLPVAQTQLNKKLLRIYFTILSRFKASLTGDPDPNNPFVRHYAPFCLQDPLVVHIIMYASACYLHETGHIPHTALMASKGRAIQMLNHRISSGQGSVVAAGVGSGSRSSGGGAGDAAIASVIQLTAAEWYWGENDQDLQHHFRGLRDMIRLRGGFDNLGMNGILAKNAMCHDVSIALAHEKSPLLLLQSQDGGGGPYLPWGADYAFTDPIKDVPLRMFHCAPFVYSLPSVGSLPTFAECAQSLGLHPATASVLDNVRFLFKAVDRAYATTTADANEPPNITTTTTTKTKTNSIFRKVQLTGKYIFEHIQGLHPTIPGLRNPSSGLSTGANSPGSNHFTGTEEGSTRSNSLSSTGTPGPGSGSLSRSPPGLGSDSTRSSEWLSAPDANEAPASPRSVAAATCRQHQPPQASSPDYMYQAVRTAAIIYSRAIMNRTPLSVTCTKPEFLETWTTTWRVPLSTWSNALGIFHWIMLAIAPACHQTPHARFVKNMLMVSTLTLGVENWAMMMGAARAGIKLHHWLQARDADGEDQDEDDDDNGENEEGDKVEGAGARRRYGREQR
ncbi:hypothetical protein CPLU01_02046 [Colletotrichum plurivorum]|uniref:Transcription factor domain-containing protein n=1 Tax=Colletotrichum plurivorum TaxID=2175906 RepID=A0A8H6KWM5_9PEZI|nr:hypothetical protein CPLU01_02046 [Colletotrichum plurivorum]